MNAVTGSSSVAKSQGQYFYVWLAAAFMVVAFGGFIPTYWSPVAAGAFRAPAIVHIHGMLMFAWVSFYFLQAWLVASGRVLNHRNWGLVGIGLFSAILCFILVTESVILNRAEAQGFGDAARRFSAVTLCAWPLMLGFFIAAIAQVRRPETHKRVITALMIGMLTPAIARVFLTVLAPGDAAAGGPPPPFVSLPPALVADLFLVAVMVRDWRTIGKPHGAYVVTGAVLLFQQVTTPLIANTDTWMSIATAFQNLSR